MEKLSIGPVQLLATIFRDLFTFLREAEYVWHPEGPDRLLKLRKSAENYSALVRFFGLGFPVSEGEILAEGMDQVLWRHVLPLCPAISTCGNFFVAHHHWPAKPNQLQNYVYFGKESTALMECFRPHFEKFMDKDVLDLGCGAGALAFEVSYLAKEVLALDISQSAISWAQASAGAQEMNNILFDTVNIGNRMDETRYSLPGRLWDIAVFNPPMAIPRLGAKNPYRDGGAYGVEIPYHFMNFAYRNLKSNGEVYCLATNPIVRGRSLFFDRFPQERWEIQEMSCLNSHFNQSLWREDRYGEQKIERIELWYLNLRKKGG